MKKIINDSLIELKNAKKNFYDYHSYHEGYAVIKEELDELWDIIKGSQSKEDMYSEAIQVISSTIRFIENLIIKKGDFDGKKRY